MGMGWEREWNHWNGRELVRKIRSRTPLQWQCMPAREMKRRSNERYFTFFYSCPNSITSNCCGFVELLCLTQIHNNSETGPQQIECLCNKSATSERAESNWHQPVHNKSTTNRINGARAIGTSRLTSTFIKLIMIYNIYYSCLHFPEYIWWQWCNFVPCLCQLVFAVILWVKLKLKNVCYCDIA